MDFEPTATFFINNFEVINYAMRKNLLAQDADVKTMVAFLNYPSIFGGMNLSNSFAHSVRGHDDQLTLWLTYLKTLSILHHDIFMVVCKLITLEGQGPIRLERLIEDIFSLNLNGMPKKEFKHYTIQYLQSDEVTNPDVKRFFDNTQCIEKEFLMDTLFTMEPFLLAIVHELVRHSYYGASVSLRTKLSNVTTIKKYSSRNIKSEFFNQDEFM